MEGNNSGLMDETKLKEGLLERLRKQSYDGAKEILEAGGLKPGQLFAVGCSTSEICGGKIGTVSSLQVAEAVFNGIWQAAKEKEVWLAVQCCEHLNRALILEREAARIYGYEEVNVVPQPKAGGAFASAAYKAFACPAAVEHVRAHGGMDIGDTLIGMHLRDVAVPVRISVKTIGEAHVVCARTRLKFVGGQRAVYDDSKM